MPRLTYGERDACTAGCRGCQNRRDLSFNPLEEAVFVKPPLLDQCPTPNIFARAAQNEFPPFVLRGDTCEMCDASSTGELYEQPSFYAMLVFVPLALYALYRFASSTWRPSNRVGVECVVYSGGSLGGDGVEAASKAWADRLGAHLDVSEAEIKVDHVGTMLKPGDDVRIDGLPEKRCHHCKTIELSQFNGLVGTVMAAQEDGDVTARVSVHGQAGVWDLPLDSLTLQPLFVDTPQDAPAVCFCITNEWASSPDFAASVAHLLAMRSGVEDLLADDGIILAREVSEANAEVLSGLAAGAVFVFCGDGVESQAGFQSAKEMLSLNDEQIVHADEAGVATDDGEHVTEALNDLELFLSTHRQNDKHMQKQELLREAIDNRAAAKGALSDRNVQQAATHIATMVRIVAMQLQQCFTFIAWDWQWPELLVGLRRWVGSWVLFDFPTLTNADCLAGGGTGAMVLSGLIIPLALLLLLCCSCCVSSYKRRKWKLGDDEAAAATAAHAANFGWALFTLGSPVAVSGIVAYPDATSAPVLLGIVSSPFWLLIPLLALHRLHKAKAAGTLHSRAFEARYGWLCSRCVHLRSPYSKFAVLRGSDATCNVCCLP